MRNALLVSRVQTPAPRPYSVSFAISSASALVLERRHGEHRAEDLLLEDPHVVVALEDGRLEVVAALELAAEVRALAADQELRALLEADLDVALDLLELRRRDLRADLRRRGRADGPAGSLAIRSRHRSMNGS